MLLEKRKFEFDDFLLDVKEKVLLRGGKTLSITPKSFQLLLVLVENHGHLVEKNELMNAVWADSFVEEANLAFTIGLLRKALGDDANKPQFIETVPKRGYRFIGEVKYVETKEEKENKFELIDNSAPPSNGEVFSPARFPRRVDETENQSPAAVVADGNEAIEKQISPSITPEESTEKTVRLELTPTKPNSESKHASKYRLPSAVFALAAFLIGAILFYQYWNLNGSPSAQDLYLQGRFYAVRENRADNDKAIQLLEQAVALDPNNALFYTELARAYGTRYFQLEPHQKQWQEKSYVALEKAFALAPDLAEAHEIRGFLLWMPANRFPHEQAIAAYRRALVLNPNLDEPHQQLGKIYLHVGLLDEALTELRKSLELNPANTMARYRIGIVLIHQGKFEEALRNLKSTPPNINPAIVGRDTVWLLISLGRREEAAEFLTELIEKNPTDEGGQFASFKALLSALAGNALQAEREIRDALEKGKGFGHFHHAAYIIACAYAVLNKPEEAVRFLQTAAEDGYPCYPLFERDANLDPIRQNPKFQSFLSAQKRQWEYYKSLPQL